MTASSSGRASRPIRLAGGGMPPQPVEVRWEVAEDEAMRRIVKQRQRTAAAASGATRCTSRSMGSKPTVAYWYRFQAGGATSRIGRTRTLPKAEDDVARLRFAFASCQHYETGFFTAYRHMAKKISISCSTSATTSTRARAATTSRAVTRGSSSRRSTTIATATPSTSSIPICRRRTRPSPSSSPPTITKSTTTTPRTSRSRTIRATSSWPGVPPPTRPTTSTCRCGARSLPMRTGDSAVPPVHLRAACVLLRPRHAAVSQRSALRRRPEGAVPGSRRSRAIAARRARRNDGCSTGFGRSERRWNVLPQQVMMAKVDQFPGAEERFSMDQWSAYDAAARGCWSSSRRAAPRIPSCSPATSTRNWVNDLKVDFKNANAPIVGDRIRGHVHHIGRRRR